VRHETTVTNLQRFRTVVLLRFVEYGALPSVVQEGKSCGLEI